MHRINSLTENYYYNWFSPDDWSWYKVTYLSGYKICNVYTNKNRVVEALRKLDGREATSYVIHDMDGQLVDRALWDDILKSIYFNDYYNCHGFAFLEGQFWFPPNIENVNMIIEDNNYQECDLASLKDKGVGLYFDTNGALLHSSKMVGTDLQSKFGITTNITHGEAEINESYAKSGIDLNRTQYYNLIP